MMASMSGKKWTRPSGISGPLRELNEALHQLREDADHASLTEIHSALATAGLPHSRATVHRAFHDGRLPRHALVLAIVRALCPAAVPKRSLGDEVERFELLWAAANHTPRTGPAAVVPAGERLTQLAITVDRVQAQMPAWERQVNDIGRQAEAEHLRMLLHAAELSGRVLATAKQDLGMMRGQFRDRARQRRQEHYRARQEHDALEAERQQSQQALDRLRRKRDATQEWLGEMSTIAESDLTPFAVPQQRPARRDDVPEAVPLPPLTLEEMSQDQP